MALSVTSVTPDCVGCDGGEQLTLVGSFPQNTPLYVYLGPNGTASDAPCYSGLRGQGAACYSLNGTTLKCFAPRVALNLAHYVLLVTYPAGPQQVALTDPFTVRPPFYYSQVFALRSILRRKWATGPRTLDDVPSLP